MLIPEVLHWYFVCLLRSVFSKIILQMCTILAVSQTPEEIFNFQDLDSEHFDSVSGQISKSVF